jgi:S1-C subfamily serine protease
LFGNTHVNFKHLRFIVSAVNPPLDTSSTSNPGDSSAAKTHLPTSQGANPLQATNVIIEQQNDSLGFELSSNFPPHVIVNVKPGSHAAKNGLKDGDILVFVGDSDVQRLSQEELLDFLASSTRDHPVKGLVFRNGSLATFQIR